MSVSNKYVSFDGPLRINPLNPRYFADGSGRAIYLTGSHTHWNLQDRIIENSIKFDYNAYLDFMQEHNHNFMRMWTWEQASWDTGWDTGGEGKPVFDPLPYVRTGPGMALDGGYRFDLDKWNEEYFKRLRSRVVEAGKRGIYVSVMFFQGWSVKKPWFPGDPWRGHPYNASNNINGINGDNDGDGEADIYSLEIKEVTQLQEALIRKVVDTVNDLDNVLYEIINEVMDKTGELNNMKMVEWHYHMVNYVKNYEAGKPEQHPVGMTSPGDRADNELMFNSPADWISPGYGTDKEYRYDPPASDGTKVVISDTDHLWGYGGDRHWVWKSFCRGINPIYMDNLKDTAEYNGSVWQMEDARKAMGDTRYYAERMNLVKMTPDKNISSTRYCLFNPGVEYLVYNPSHDCPEFTVNLLAGTYIYEWFNPPVSRVEGKDTITVETGKVWFAAPFIGDAVLYVYLPT